jgi:hypothetical protein
MSATKLEDHGAQVEWPPPPQPTGIRTIGHCSTCMAGRVSEDAPVTRIANISAMADGRWVSFCDACLTAIVSFAPKAVRR